MHVLTFPLSKSKTKQSQDTSKPCTYVVAVREKRQDTLILAYPSSKMLILHLTLVGITKVSKQVVQ